jgi:hypothetical protein
MATEDISAQEAEEFSSAQTELLNTYRKRFHDRYGEDASPKEIFENQEKLDWTLFMLSFPSIAFTIQLLQQLFTSTDELFVDEFKREMWGILDPFDYFSGAYYSRIEDWRRRIDLLIQGRVTKGTWDNKLYEFKAH